MYVDWVARGIAMAGVVIALASLGWNVFAWRRQGPAIQLKAKCSGRGADMVVGGNVRNIGRFDSELENARFSWRIQDKMRLPSCGVPAKNITGITFPQPLPAEKGMEFEIADLRDLDLGLQSALHDQRVVYLTFQTASGRKAKKTVRYARN